MIKTATVPTKYTTAEDKFKWAVRADKVLLDLHNWLGEWVRNGKTQEEYNTLPQKIKNMFPYESKLTIGQFDRFRAWHQSAITAVHKVMHQSKTNPPMGPNREVTPEMQAHMALRQSAVGDTSIDVNIDRDLN